MTAIDLAALEAAHVEVGLPAVSPLCRLCETAWPCDAAKLLARIRDLEAREAALREEPNITHFVALATAVHQVRTFLALHREATGRSDVNIRKVLKLLDEALSDAPVAEETPQ